MNQAIEWINEEWKKIDYIVENNAKYYINKKSLHTNFINLYRFLFFCFSYKELFAPAEKYCEGSLGNLTDLVNILPYELYQTNIENYKQNENSIIFDIINSFVNSKNEMMPETNIKNENEKIFKETEVSVKRESKKFLLDFSLLSKGKKEDIDKIHKSFISNIRTVRIMIRHNVEYPHFFYYYFSLIDKNRFLHIKDSRFFEWFYLKVIK